MVLIPVQATRASGLPTRVWNTRMLQVHIVVAGTVRSRKRFWLVGNLIRRCGMIPIQTQLLNWSNLCEQWQL